MVFDGPTFGELEDLTSPSARRADHCRSARLPRGPKKRSALLAGESRERTAVQRGLGKAGGSQPAQDLRGSR